MPDELTSRLSALRSLMLHGLGLWGEGHCWSLQRLEALTVGGIGSCTVLCAAELGLSWGCEPVDGCYSGPKDDHRLSYGTHLSWPCSTFIQYTAVFGGQLLIILAAM